MKKIRIALAPTLALLLTGTVPAANMSPVALTGFNRDLVIESISAGPPYSTALELNPGENLAFYQSGLPGKTRGFPASGLFTSVLDGTTQFQLQDYSSANALVLSSGTGLSAGTLSLVTPQIFNRLAILANSASGGGVTTLTLNFSDGSSVSTSYNAPDWFGNAGFALQGFERIDLTSGSVSGGSMDPRLYQTTIDLAALQGGSNRPLISITFNKVASAGATGIYAVSGEIAPPTPAAILLNPTNATVAEATSAAFTAVATGNPTPTLQWLRNGAPIPGATNTTYNFTAALADNTAAFRLVASNFVSNISYVATSSPAILTVIADTNKPVLLGAQSLGLTQVLASFSEAIKFSTATNTANFSVTGTNGARTILNAAPDSTQSNIVLAVTGMTDGATYLLTVNNLADQSASANVISNNSQVVFTASIYVPAGIGSPSLPGSLTVAGNGWNISGGGADLGGTNDQFQFNYVQRTGDFDVLVRLDSLSLADAWSEAGMLVRESLAPGARGASVMATPTISGCYFQTRGTTNGATTLSGSFPANYPNTWLRLKRSGNDFTGFAGFDGRNWTQLGTANITLPATVYFGFAVASHNASQLATAAFRDFATVTNAGVNAQLTAEPLGQCSRRTSLVISEIMYHPTNTLLEFVEIFNSRGEPQDLSGYKLRGSADFDFPNGTILPGGGFLVIAKSPADLQGAYGLSGVLGPFTGSLPNSTGTVKLLNQSGGVMLQVDYSDSPPWPVAADGAGHSLVLARPSLGENNPQAWAASDSVGGSPGKLDAFTPDPLRNVVINEFLAHTDLPDVDYIELYNHGGQAVDISGAVLTDDPATNIFVIPAGTILSSNGFYSVNANTLGFSLNAAGETIYFKNAAGTRIIDVVKFDGQENGVALGRWPDGAGQFYRLAAKTPGTNNASLLISDVVINELMYHPLSGDNADQYVELYNRSSNAVNLAGWTLTDGVSFTFPTNSVIAAGGYFVVAKDPLRLLTNYPTLNASNTAGNFSGSLSGSGERVALTKPVPHTTVVGGITVTNPLAITVDEVTYGTGGRWPAWSDGGGSSLERIDPHANPRLSSNWADSDETQKAPWTIVSATGTIDNGSVSADQLQVLLQGAGECLIDNVQVLSNGVNRIANSTFETDASGWTAEGTESASGLETGSAYAGTKSYHLRAVERGDNQVNRVRTPLTSALASGTTNVTIQAAVRWLKGSPDILLRLRGNWLECAGVMAPPVRPGTPGARNSRYITNAPPAITEVIHSPVLPPAGQNILVTARVEDPDGVASVQLKYRLDPSATYSTVVMNDSGTAGDAVAHDGIFTGTILPQAAGTMIAFYVQATDGAVAAATSVFPNDAPVRECLARVGEVQPTGNFPVYRLWMTQATLNTWTSRNKLDNTPFDVTFVLGDRRVIYNAQALYAGSPYIAPGYISPVAGRCGYSIDLPSDDLFLGENAIVVDWPGGHGFETTALQEQMGYWIADKLNLPNSHRYTIRLHVNGVTDDARQAVFEAVQQPAGGFLKQWMPDQPKGEFFKVDRAFEFNDAGSLVADPQPRLQNFTTTGGAKKREKYRWNFSARAADGFNDYSSIFALVDSVNTTAPEPYTSATLGLVDAEEWMRIFATEHIIANFDAYGHEIGKNMYAFKPTGGKWQLYMFDLDWLMLAAAQTGRTASSANLFLADDPTITTMYAFPPFARAYWRAVEDAINGPLLAVNCNPVMDAKYQSLLANGVSWCDGGALTDPTVVKTWFSQRLAFLQSQLATVQAPFAANSTITVSNGVATIIGTAPIHAGTVSINGVVWPVRWTSVSNWTATVTLTNGSNAFSVVAVDVNGQPIAGASNNVSVTYGGAIPSPVDAVVINELMFNPALTNAEYVELFNTSSNYTFDLSGWDFNGLSYTFPAGSFISPRGFLTLTKDRNAFDLAYGASNLVFDSYSGNLQSEGETLSLLKPAGQTNPPIVVDRVHYEVNAPWPAAAPGVSLQLVDSTRDNARAANWATGQSSTNPPWIYFATNGLATSSRLYLYLQSAGDIYLDDLKIVAGALPEAGSNLVTNGGFETALLGTWTSTANFASSAVSTAIKHAGSSSLHLIATAAGSGSGNAIFQDLPVALTNGQTYALSFWYRPTTNGGPLTIRLSGVGLNATLNPAPLPPYTPTASNNVTAALPAFPALWLNEAQADNVTGPLDNFSQHDPWVELFNAGTNALSLSGYYLSDTYTNLTKWAFPTNAALASNSFNVVWCDNQTNQITNNVLHTNFRLASGTGSVVLSRVISNQVQVVDYLNYSGLPANWSYGAVPDGQPFYRNNLFYATPGGTNNGSSPPITIFINEWLADNTHTLLDPADAKYEDWFELYNPGTLAVDVGGYYLTDTLANKTQFLIPNNGHYLVPAHGFLLVWADNKSTANATNVPDLHANFALSKSGEAIGLFASDGTTIDAITFGAQTSDVSEGRYPDGTANIVPMTQPTPGTNNFVPNTAPTLAAIAPKEVTIGQTLIFTASATDSNFPPQILTFSLDTGAPVGATINATSGEFNWAPMLAPATNSISIIVTDNGAPSLSATQTFTVTVYLPPTISVQFTGNQLQLTWPRGTLQAADDLTGPFLDVTTTSPFYAPSSGGQRFFRIRL